MDNTFHTIEEILQDIKKGKIVVMLDDQDRENEGDVICAAEYATPENVNFMAAYAKGLICMPGSAIVAYAKQFLGNPYVYGGASLTNGTDCSGFTMSVYAHFGYGLSRSSYTQVNNGRAVSMSSLQPGDLLFYKYGGSTISHVAIYIGGGQIIHASTEETGIIISGMGSPCAARRIIG